MRGSTMARSTSETRVPMTVSRPSIKTMNPAKIRSCYWIAARNTGPMVGGISTPDTITLPLTRPGKS
jgi:hypothetical protein